MIDRNTECITFTSRLVIIRVYRTKGLFKAYSTICATIIGHETKIISEMAEWVVDQIKEARLDDDLDVAVNYRGTRSAKKKKRIQQAIGDMDIDKANVMKLLMCIF